MKKVLVLCFFSTVLFGCSVRPSVTPDVAPPQQQLADGFISLNRIAPIVSSPAALLGFMPNASSDEAKSSWLKIDLTHGKLQLMNGEDMVEETEVEGKLSIQPGMYVVQHKQRSPLWYAGDEYFSARGLAIPQVGDKERYRRGALGDFALFVDNESSIHSAPIWTPEVGGLRIDDEKMKKIYYSLEVGASVTVQ